MTQSMASQAQAQISLYINSHTLKTEHSVPKCSYRCIFFQFSVILWGNRICFCSFSQKTFETSANMNRLDIHPESLLCANPIFFQFPSSILFTLSVYISDALAQVLAQSQMVCFVIQWPIFCRNNFIFTLKYNFMFVFTSIAKECAARFPIMLYVC